MRRQKVRRGSYWNPLGLSPEPAGLTVTGPSFPCWPHGCVGRTCPRGTVFLYFQNLILFIVNSPFCFPDVNSNFSFSSPRPGQVCAVLSPRRAQGRWRGNRTTLLSRSVLVTRSYAGTGVFIVLLSTFQEKSITIPRHMLLL